MNEACLQRWQVPASANIERVARRVHGDSTDSPHDTVVVSLSAEQAERLARFRAAVSQNSAYERSLPWDFRLDAGIPIGSSFFKEEAGFDRRDTESTAIWGSDGVAAT